MEKQGGINGQIQISCLQQQPQHHNNNNQAEATQQRKPTGATPPPFWPTIENQLLPGGHHPAVAFVRQNPKPKVTGWEAVVGNAVRGLAVQLDRPQKLARATAPRPRQIRDLEGKGGNVQDHRRQIERKLRG